MFHTKRTIHLLRYVVITFPHSEEKYVIYRTYQSNILKNLSFTCKHIYCNCDHHEKIDFICRYYLRLLLPVDIRN